MQCGIMGFRTIFLLHRRHWRITTGLTAIFNGAVPDTVIVQDSGRHYPIQGYQWLRNTESWGDLVRWKELMEGRLGKSGVSLFSTRYRLMNIFETPTFCASHDCICPPGPTLAPTRLPVILTHI